MGTTVWVSDGTREALRELQKALGESSADATIRRLIERPGLDARTIFALHHDAIKAILRKHKLRKLVAFGSRARGDAKPTSDLDLAAELAPGAAPLSLLSAEEEIERAVGLSVNLVELPNPKLGATIASEGVPFGS